MKRISRASALRALGPGLHVLVRASSDEAIVRQRLESTTDSALLDSVTAYYPTEEPTNSLVGAATESQLRLSMPDRDRKPWWLLSPVFHGSIDRRADGETVVDGSLRVRRRTITAAALAMPAALLFPISSGVWVLGLVAWVGFACHVFFALPHTCSSLIERLESVCQGTSHVEPR